MTNTRHLYLKRGDTKRHLLEVRIGCATVDITAWTDFVLAVNSEKEPDDDYLDTQIGTITGVITDGPNGLVAFSPPGTWEPGFYYYDAQAVDENGETCTFSEGGYTITQDIAK